jgi:hypothetical protein
MAAPTLETSARGPGREPPAREHEDGRYAGRLWPLAVALGLFALGATLTSATGRYIGDNRFELYWAPFELLERHVAVWDATRGLGRPRWDFWPGTTAIIAVLRGIGLGPDLAERVWHAALLTTAGIGAAATLRLFRPRVGIEHWVAVGIAAGVGLVLGLLLGRK